MCTPPKMFCKCGGIGPYENTRHVMESSLPTKNNSVNVRVFMNQMLGLKKSRNLPSFLGLQRSLAGAGQKKVYYPQPMRILKLNQPKQQPRSPTQSQTETQGFETQTPQRQRQPQKEPEREARNRSPTQTQTQTTEAQRSWGARGVCVNRNSWRPATCASARVSNTTGHSLIRRRSHEVCAIYMGLATQGDMSSPGPMPSRQRRMRETPPWREK